MKLDPDIQIVMHSVLYLKPGVTVTCHQTYATFSKVGKTISGKFHTYITHNM